ncbi:MAG: phosphatidylglycerophosphatase A [Nitrospirota bacterium]|nr:phosphatidylglycerophosphatase A [Nitrospirota bacterium]
MDKINDRIVLFIAQGAYSGRVPFAPGTAGTAAAVLLYLLLKALNPGAYLGVCVLVTVLGTWMAGEAELLLRKKDSPSIVIDEIAGFLVAMFLVPASWEYIVAAFLLFRFFDIVKPWPINGLQKVSGGAGVMLDDLGAGIFTNIVLQIAARNL